MAWADMSAYDPARPFIVQVRTPGASGLNERGVDSFVYQDLYVRQPFFAPKSPAKKEHLFKSRGLLYSSC